MSSLPFPMRFRWKQMGEITFIGETSPEFSLRSSSLPICSLAEILIPTYWSSCYKKVKFFLGPRIWLLVHINLMEYSWGHFKILLESVKCKSKISSIFFLLNRGENTITYPRETTSKLKKQQRFLVRPITIHLSLKDWILSRDPVSLIGLWARGYFIIAAVSCIGVSYNFFMSFCRILSTLCSQVVFHNVPHISS